MKSTQSQARSFTTIFLIEMWERFGYYGMAALLVLFMIEHSGFTDSQANLTWGGFAALVYTSPALGGWIGDKVLGARRTMVFGTFVLVCGYALLTLSSERLTFMYIALGVIVVGNGLFKSNSANLVRRIYEGEDARLDSAFTIYYMAVNIGSTLSMLATPWIKDRWGWSTAFAVCGVGMLLGVLNFFIRYRSLLHIGSLPDQAPIAWRRVGYITVGGILLALAAMFVIMDETLAALCVYVAVCAIIGIFGYMLIACQRSERPGLIAALILVIQTLLFFIFYQQTATSLTLFALRNVDPVFSIFNVALFSWNAAQFQALNPIWIMLLSPPLAWLYTRLEHRSIHVPVAAKFALGFAIIAAGYFVYAISGRYAMNAHVSSWFMVAGYGLNSLGELLISGLGLAMISRYVPARMSGFMMGTYFIATGVSQYIGSVIANVAQLPSSKLDPMYSLTIYTDFFAKLGWLAVASAMFAILLLPLMNRLSNEHRQHKEQSGVLVGS